MNRRCLAPDDLKPGMHVIITDVKPPPQGGDDQFAEQLEVITATLQPSLPDRIRGLPLRVAAVDLPFLAAVPDVRGNREALSIDVRRVHLIRAGDEFVAAFRPDNRPWWKRLLGVA